MSGPLTDYIKFWGRVADYYEKSLKLETLQMYAEDVKHLSLSDLVKAFAYYRRDPDNKFMPLPGQLLGFITPVVKDQDNANEAATRIFGAIRKFGWSNSKDARLYVGELGWRVVELNGGWQELCKSTNDRMIPTLTAQFRELAKSQLTKAKAGRLNEVPSLTNTHPEVLNLVAELAEAKSKLNEKE